MISDDIMNDDIDCYKYSHIHQELFYSTLEEELAFLKYWQEQGEFNDIAFLKSLTETEMYRLIKCDGRVSQTGYYWDDVESFHALPHESNPFAHATTYLYDLDGNLNKPHSLASSTQKVIFNSFLKLL